MKKAVKPIAIDELETYLWGAAVLLRGSIDATSYKEYIFPLLFFKRISDVWDEEYNRALEESGGDEEYAAEAVHVVNIPEDSHWNDVRKVTENVGQALVGAFKRIESANPPQRIKDRTIGGLSGIFGATKIWTNKDTMPDDLISKLIEHFSRLTLTLAACPADEMGTGYEYLVGKFADDAGHTAQEFYTNRTVVELMARILKPGIHDSIYDPTCGSGGMLIKCLASLKEQGGEWRGVKVYGQEMNAITSSIARMNLFLHGVEDFTIACGDTLMKPAFIKNGRLRQFDIVLANPPYSIKQWNREAFANDIFGRNLWGTPPQGRADYAFIQHIIYSLDDNSGRCAILLPHGVLNRMEEQEIRRKIVESDCVEAVIGLGRHLFYNSGLESCILVCRKQKMVNRKGKILFIEAENYIHKKGTFSFLSPEDIDVIANAYDSDDPVPGVSCLISQTEVLANDGNLNVKLYVKKTDQTPCISNIDCSLIQEYLDLSNRLKEQLSKLARGIKSEISEKFEIDNIEWDDSGWDEVTLGDIATEYAERCDNPSESEYNCFIGSDCIGQYDFKIQKTASTAGVTSAQKVFAKGDYLLVRRSLFGSDFRERAPRAEFGGVCSADILTIREKADKIYNGFLIYVLYSRKLWDFIVSNSTGSLTRRIKWKQLCDFKFKLPPQNVQKEITDLLWAAYELKESYKKLLAATDEMGKSRFIEMFGDIETCVEYSPMPLGRISEIVSGITKGRKTKETELFDVPYMAVSNVKDGYIDWTNVKTIKATAAEISQYRLFPADVLIAEGGDADKVGRGAIIMQPPENCIHQNHIFRVRLNQSQILPTFFAEYLMQSTAKRYFLRSAKQTTGIASINMTQLRALPVIVPPLALQKAFVSFIEQLDKSKLELKGAIEKLDRVMRSLLP